VVDELTPQNPGPESPYPDAGMPVDPVADDGGLRSSPRGKLVVIAAAVVGFLLIGGLAVGAFFIFFAGEAVDQAGEQIQGTVGSVPTTGTAGGGEAVAAAVEPEPASLSDVYTFRDIFQPLLVPKPEEDDADGAPSGEEDVTPDVEPDVLFLQDIVSEDGVTYAVLIWNSQTYELTQGEAIPTSPWQVLSIGSGSVTMLYGDEQVVLIVGQGITTTPTEPVQK